MSDRVLVWIRVGAGVKVCALAMSAPEARADPGPNYVTPDELATLRLSPQWPDRESMGEIVVLGPSWTSWADLDESGLLDQVQVSRQDTWMLAFLRDQEHRCGDPRPRLLTAIYSAMAEEYEHCGLCSKATRARRKARRWQSVIDGPSQSSAK